jgi:hypothetical protein
MSTPVDVFISYAPEDERFLQQLERHLSPMTQPNLIRTWHAGKVRAGEEAIRIIIEKLESAHVIVILISSDFLYSTYLYFTELTRALERNAQGAARIIPILVRDVDLSPTPFKYYKTLPADGRSVAQASDIDAAWKEVARGIRHRLEHMGAIPAQSAVGTRSSVATPMPGLSGASTYHPPQYPYGPPSTGPHSSPDPRYRQSQPSGSGWGVGSPQGPAYNPAEPRRQTGATLQSSSRKPALSPKVILGALLAGAALLILAVVSLSSVLGSHDEGGCRTPIPETRMVDPPAGHTSGALRTGPGMTSTQIEEVPRGKTVTIMSAGRGIDQECWYRVRVKGTEHVGWMHSVNIP